MRPAIEHPSRRRASAGFYLIEVMIGMLVLSVSFLGAGSVLLNSMKANHGASLRNAAVLLASDMAERLEANRVAARNGRYELAAGTVPTATTDCTAQLCTADQLATFDVARWYQLVQSKLPSANAVVTRTAIGPPSVYQIELTWTDRAWGGRGTGATETFTYRTTRTVSP